LISLSYFTKFYETVNLSQNAGQSKQHKAKVKSIKAEVKKLRDKADANSNSYAHLKKIKKFREQFQKSGV